MNNSSPCIAHCTTGLGDNVCRGCGRTFIEVANWSVYNEAERARIMTLLPWRQRLQGFAAPFGGVADITDRGDGEWGRLRVDGRTLWFRPDGEAWLFEVEATRARLLLEHGGAEAALRRWLSGIMPSGSSV